MDALAAAADRTPLPSADQSSNQSGAEIGKARCGRRVRVRSRAGPRGPHAPCA
jgi:hypothetical protein